MLKALPVLLVVCSAVESFAQVGGGVATFGRETSSDSARTQELAKRKSHELPNAKSVFVDAGVMINVKADSFVAVFGISVEGEDLEKARSRMAETLEAFRSNLRQAGVRPEDVNDDFVSQNRIYGFEVAGDLAKEVVVGFEFKKTVSVKFDAIGRLDALAEAASKAGVFDLVKVDYVVTDLEGVRARLMKEASRIVKQKVSQLEGGLGLKFGKPKQVYAQEFGTYYPTAMYSSYVAQESQQMFAYRQNYNLQMARKPRTAFFDALDASIFDVVIDPVVVEPVVQFTVYFKVRYEAS
ncbi:MAG: SIMPL domain-containing protein [Nitrospirae bacterium]|nr:SIMPL domain-containing protein [Fimbriimonadaceae bacterium]